MLIAYIDEIGEPGAFVSRDHARFKTSPAFGYAGFILPEGAVRQFGAEFNRHKRELFPEHHKSATNPGQWEVKGANIFRPSNAAKYPQHNRVFSSLAKRVEKLGGKLFYYAEEKPIGTPKQTWLDQSSRETGAMQQCLNRLATEANRAGQNLIVLIDKINESQRSERVSSMYGHILGRAEEHKEMRRIVEPPMHVDSKLSSNIQFADWIAAYFSRAIDFQLLADSPHKWALDWWHNSGLAQIQLFTKESKLRLCERSIDDLYHRDLMNHGRRVAPRADSHPQKTIQTLQRIHAAGASMMRRRSGS